jgi:8-oxo-dGTP pyrophosphatase MutT (NUDIX family)
VPEPVTVRDAATVILVRDGHDERGEPAVEVCMLRRNLNSDFVGGAYVFPGGSVDPLDHGPDAEALCRGRNDADASAELGVESGGLAFWVAALRECFEEAGVLVAQPRRGSPSERDALLDTSDPGVAARFAGYRDAVNAGTMGLLEVCRLEDLVLAADTVHYVSHWITPDLAPRRYDTRFFVTAAPAGQVARHDEGETIATVWIRPSAALALNAEGGMELLPPTIANLASIGSFRTTEEVTDWARRITDVPTVLPVVVIEDGQVLILRPGDEGYEQALADRLRAGSTDEDELAVARRIWGSG